MSHMRLWASAAIITVVILVAFALSVPHTRDIKLESPTPPEAETKIPTVILNDAFKKGLHTLSGSVEAPNACSLVSASATIVENASSTQSVLIAISVQKDEGICLQVPTRINFKTTISAPANLPITATVNGFPASLTSS